MCVSACVCVSQQMVTVHDSVCVCDVQSPSFAKHTQAHSYVCDCIYSVSAVCVYMCVCTSDLCIHIQCVSVCMCQCVCVGYLTVRQVEIFVCVSCSLRRKGAIWMSD